MKKTVSLLLAALLILSVFAGCSENKAPVDTTDEPAKDAAVSEEVDPNAAAELSDGYDPETDTDLDAARGGNTEAPLAGTVINGQNYTFTNSKLVDYTNLSPNKTIHRNHKIDTITIHCTKGKLTVETWGSIFAESKSQASANYGVGDDGRIGLYVQEWDRSWQSSNAANDHRAITVMVAADSSAPYAVSDTAYQATIKLVADICKRNGIEKLIWSDDKEVRIQHLNGANMTVHSDFVADKDCPGEYLYSRMDDIAAQVNTILEETKEKTVTGSPCSEEKTFAFENYLVKIKKDTGVRKNPGVKYSVFKSVKKNEVYTIVEEKTVDNIKWGRLKNYQGWIDLKDAEKVKQ